jgi:hypothetical protein
MDFAYVDSSALFRVLRSESYSIVRVIFDYIHEVSFNSLGEMEYLNTLMSTFSCLANIDTYKVHHHLHPIPIDDANRTESEVI